MSKVSGFLVIFVFCASSAHSALVININQSGSDVVADVSGSLNVSGMVLTGAGSVSTAVRISGRAFLSYDGEIIFGSPKSQHTYRINSAARFSNGRRYLADSQTGDDLVGITLKPTAGEDRLHVPFGYVSGTPLAGTATFANQTISGMGLIPGTYLIGQITLNIGSPPTTTYTVGGSISGLTGTGLQLQNNGADTYFAPPSATSFTFSTPLADSAAYGVTILSQPSGQACTVGGGDNSNGTGNVAGADITSITITCADLPAPTYSVGGTVSGVDCGGPPGCLWLENNGGDEIYPDNGPFSFPTKLADGEGYSVTVAGKPGDQTCTVSGGDNGDGTGTISSADVTDITVACADTTPTYSVNATVTGGNGSVVCAPISVSSGGSSTCTASPDSGFQVSAWTGDCASAGTSNTCNLTNILADKSATVSFEAEPVTTFTGTLPSGATGTLSFTTADTGCTFATPPQFLDTVSPPPPASVFLVDGVISFAITGCVPGATVTVSMDYGSTLPNGSNYWKADTPWYRLPADINGSVVTFEITDGSGGDTDGTVNGSIVDPGGAATGDIASPPTPPTAPSRPIPTMSAYGLLITALGLVFVGWRRLQKTNKHG